jgi:putative methionine-R-sulfoxide reductase with GAF domain
MKTTSLRLDWVNQLFVLNGFSAPSRVVLKGANSENLALEIHGAVTNSTEVEHPQYELFTSGLFFPLIDRTQKEMLQLLEWYESIFTWLVDARNLAPELCDWIGVYLHGPALGLNGDEVANQLFVGPYLGEVTEHYCIPVSEGMCGLAFRERRIVNLADVHSDPRHIACSLKTRSELIIPLFNAQGEMIAELDIDSHTSNAFTTIHEALFTEHAQCFPQNQR